MWEPQNQFLIAHNRHLQEKKELCVIFNQIEEKAKVIQSNTSCMTRVQNSGEKKHTRKHRKTNWYNVFFALSLLAFNLRLIESGRNMSDDNIK